MLYPLSYEGGEPKVTGATTAKAAASLAERRAHR
jgi:hypothetical protein